MTSKEEISAFMAREFPQSAVAIDHIDATEVVVRQCISNDNLRPGGTVSGPTMFALADTAIYVAILAEIGLVALAVTTNLTINFLRKPVADRDLIARCRLLKSGRVLVVGEVNLFSDGDARPVAHAVGTYSIPPTDR
jgi:uncharacterized protein (TIGR00369 family)